MQCHNRSLNRVHGLGAGDMLYLCRICEVNISYCWGVISTLHTCFTTPASTCRVGSRPDLFTFETCQKVTHILVMLLAMFLLVWTPLQHLVFLMGDHLQVINKNVTQGTRSINPSVYWVFLNKDVSVSYVLLT